MTGTVHPDRLVTNAGGEVGDLLVLTKPLGTGAIVAARKRGAADDALLASAVTTMTELNARGSEAALAAAAHAMTDVTGFGLLGHLHNLSRARGLAAESEAAALPVLDGVRELLESGEGRSGGSDRNGRWASQFTTVAYSVELWRERLALDATTSGGLLVAVPEPAADSVPGAVVGRLVEGAPGTITVR